MSVHVCGGGVCVEGWCVGGVRGCVCLWGGGSVEGSVGVWGWGVKGGVVWGGVVCVCVGVRGL